MGMALPGEGMSAPVAHERSPGPLLSLVLGTNGKKPLSGDGG
jgi:hypothetical protein